MIKIQQELNQIKCFRGIFMSYLVWINNLVIVDNGEEYDFLDEMYPEIKNQYNIIWALKNKASKPIEEDTRMKINRIQDDIDTKLNILGVNDRILFIQKDDIFVEPISGEEFNLSKKSLQLREASEEERTRYIAELTTNNTSFLKSKMTEFKENISSYQKRK